MVPLFSFSVKYEEAVGRVVGWPGLCQGRLGECRRPEREDCSDCENAHDYRPADTHSERVVVIFGYWQTGRWTSDTPSVLDGEWQVNAPAAKGAQPHCAPDDVVGARR
jgi:hypothetical protein